MNMRNVCVVTKYFGLRMMQFGRYTNPFQSWSLTSKAVKRCTDFPSSFKLNNLEIGINNLKTSNRGLKTMNMPHLLSGSLKLYRPSPFHRFHSQIIERPKSLSCAFSTYASCLNREKHITGPVFAKRSGSPNKIGRSVTKSNRHSDGSKFVFPISKYKRIQDRTGQHFKRRVSKLRARIAHHNRYLQEKWSVQRFRGSAVVGKLRKKFHVKVCISLP